MKSIVVCLAVLGMVLVAGCGDSQTGRSKEKAEATPHQKQSGAQAIRVPVYGEESFILCTQFADGPVGYLGGSYLVMGKQMAQGAVIVVAAKDGLEIRGTRFPYRQVVLIDEKEGSPVPRVAAPSDQVVLNQSAQIFGKPYPKGRVTIPQDGMLPE
jgi:hypothetical protein